MAAAARDYGLTVGSRDTPQISLTDLGRGLLYAPSAEIDREKKIEAFFKIEKFKQVYDFYEGSNLPEQQYLSNALENQFQIEPADHDEFTTVFKANCKYLGIENGLGGVAKGTTNAADAKGIETRSLGKPKGEFDRTAFVIMPFSEKGKQERPNGFFDEVLKSVITPAGNAAGFAIETARRENSDIIHHTIINELLNADLVIGDLTDHNPNVLLELGIRLAKEKPVVLIKSKDTGPVFDVDNLLRVYTYDQNLWSTTVQADVKALTERIGGTWDNREHTVGYMRNSDYRAAGCSIRRVRILNQRGKVERGVEPDRGREAGPGSWLALPMRTVFMSPAPQRVRSCLPQQRTPGSPRTSGWPRRFTTASSARPCTQEDGNYVAVAVESGDFEVDADDYAATGRLLARRPGARLWLMRTGPSAAYRM